MRRMLFKESAKAIIDPRPRRAGVWSVVLIGLSFVVLFILRALPEFDVAVSAIFFEKMTCWLGPNGPGFNKYSPRCGKFLLSQNYALEFIRMAIWWFISFIAIGAFFWCFWLVWNKDLTQLHGIKAPLTGVVSYLIGPALITNVILKEYWGRPRPYTTFDFGSKLPYVSPGDISMHCDTNCSFVSGEATAAFWLFWIVLFLPHKYRAIGIIVIACLAIYVSLSWVMFGAHYFSDVVMSGMIALTSIAIACWFVRTRFVSRYLAKLFG